MPKATSELTSRSISEVYRDAKILLAGRNFGGGSSREAAVYALYDHGFRCVIAPSFGDIFAQNAVKNGLLTAIVTEAEIAELAAAISANPAQEINVDLERQTISCGNGAVRSRLIRSVAINC